MDNYRKTPTVFQMEATECGAASLAMILAFFGKIVPLEQMRIETGVSRDGVKAGNIMRAAKRFGLECHGYNREPEKLLDMEMPCIVHWNFNHFVVLEGFKGQHVFINDPAVGRRKLTREEFDDGFTGIVLTFKLTDAFVPEKAQNSLLGLVKQRLHGQYAAVFMLFYIGLLLFFPGLVLPVVSQMFIDDILIAGYTDWLTKILVFMAALIVLKAGLTFYRDIVLQRLQSKLVLISGRSFLSHLVHLPMNFYEQRHSGDLVERMENNTDVSNFLAGDLAETVLNVIIAAFYLVLLFFYSPLMTIIGLGNIAISIFVVIYSKQVLANAAIKQQMSGGKLFSTVCAGIGISDTLKASGAENEYIMKILGYQAKYQNENQEQTRFQRIISAIPDSFGKITDILHLLVGSILVINGSLSMGMLTAYCALYSSFVEPVNALVTFTQKIHTMKSRMNRVDDVLHQQEDPRYSTAKKSDQQRKLSGEVQLKDISFGYNRFSPPLVEGFSFSLNCGETIAFVGPSGCGKSTVAKVVSGLYAPWSGSILFDGKEAVSYSKEIMTSSISTVSQNITLFSGSIRDNIAMWNTALLESDIVAAAKDACIHDFIISCPGGYDYNLSENASNISGGQKQRLEIARALATNPSILIMDEATSALDPIIEKQVMDNIKRRGCTCILVAHRLSAIRDCNQIVVMRNGKIIQRGNHKSLMQEDGFYRTFVENI